MSATITRNLALAIALFFCALPVQAEGIKVKSTAWWPSSAEANQLPAMTNDLAEPREEISAVPRVLLATGPLLPTGLKRVQEAPISNTAESVAWRLSDFVRSIGVDLYTGSYHNGSDRRNRPVAEGGLNEDNSGSAVVITLNLHRFYYWPGRYLRLVHDSYRTEFYLKALGRIDRNSNDGSANHWGAGVVVLYTPQVSLRWRLLAGVGAERLRITYCVPRFNACAKLIGTIPYYLVGAEYVSKGLRIVFAPKMKYYLAQGSNDPDASRVTLNAYRLSGEIAFWGL